jgi:hypothetical protein
MGVMRLAIDQARKRTGSARRDERVQADSGGLRTPFGSPR